LSTRLTNKKHDDDQLRVPSEPQELSDHVSSGGQTTSYDKPLLLPLMTNWIANQKP
jgi:hypothetical protein